MYRKIIVAMDGSEDSLSAVAEACALAKVHGSESVTLVTVLSERRFAKASRRGVEEQAALSTKHVSKAMAMLDAEGVTNELVLLNGKAAEEIGRYALKVKADLLVAGSKFFRKVAKSVSVAAKAPSGEHKVASPVMVVKARGHDGFQAGTAIPEGEGTPTEGGTDV